MEQTVITELSKYVDEKKRDFYPTFFKTGAGEYAEGDKFLGVTVPHVRKVAKKYANLPLTDVHTLMISGWHEVRLVALFILVHQYEKGTLTQREEIFDFYIAHTHYINNWDLVDASATKIVGAYALVNGTAILLKYANSKDIWQKRIAMVATLAFIKEKELKVPYQIAEMLMHDQHDLIHKAVGWMLREAGKVDAEKLKKFLNKHAGNMPRTALRYSIELFPEKERKAYLQK